MGEKNHHLVTKEGKNNKSSDFFDKMEAASAWRFNGSDMKQSTADLGRPWADGRSTRRYLNTFFRSWRIPSSSIIIHRAPLLSIQDIWLIDFISVCAFLYMNIWVQQYAMHSKSRCQRFLLGSCFDIVL